MADDLIRIILADDHAVVRAGLKAVLGSAKDMLVVGEASTGPEAVEMAARLKPEVVVMDLSIGEVDGGEATKMLIEQGIPSRVLILTMHPEEDYLVPMLEAGATGFLPKTAADRELVEAVRTVSRGDIFVRPEAARILAKGYQRKDPMAEDRSKYERLTDRERDVLRLVAQGYSAPEIGERLFISPKTVDTYKARIQDKLGLSHRHEYVQLALRLGLLQDGE
ncbi:MAG: response regulator transcription factor [Gemmatimonadetes bacterium]|nr:response regulator transcription factor [Gemmatimonadota bacterium]